MNIGNIVNEAPYCLFGLSAVRSAISHEKLSRLIETREGIAKREPPPSDRQRAFPAGSRTRWGDDFWSSAAALRPSGYADFVTGPRCSVYRLISRSPFPV